MVRAVFILFFTICALSLGKTSLDAGVLPAATEEKVSFAEVSVTPAGVQQPSALCNPLIAKSERLPLKEASLAASCPPHVDPNCGQSDGHSCPEHSSSLPSAAQHEANSNLSQSPLAQLELTGATSPLHLRPPRLTI